VSFLSRKAKSFVPEVIQSSATDCGPACLKSFLEGFGVHASYGRLREACQTDVDGTSLDTLEETANRLGLIAEQRVVPVDHLLLPESASLPAIVVVLTSAGLTHFVLVWKRIGPWLQVMDPAVGRRWIRAVDFMDRVHIHAQSVSAADWREWAGSEAFLGSLRRRMAELRIRRTSIPNLIDVALRDSTWRGLAALDAGLRMASALVFSGAFRRGNQIEDVLAALLADVGGISPHFWFAKPAPYDNSTLRMRGPVILHASSFRGVEDRKSLSPELTAALHEPRVHALKELAGMLRLGGQSTVSILLLASITAGAGVVLEALLFRGLLDLGHLLPTLGQRVAAVTGLLVFFLLMLLLEWPLQSGWLRLGRMLETRFRVRFLEKLPRLQDRYFQSRLISDMAERAHNIHQLRLFPSWLDQVVRPISSIVLTVAAISWFFPHAVLLAAVSAFCSLAVPLLGQSVLSERDLARREHEGALSLFSFDTLRGLSAIRAHAAASRFQKLFQERLSCWAEAGLRFQRVFTLIEAAQAFLTLAPIVLLVFRYADRSEDLGGLLLLVYWGMSIPFWGQEFSAAVSRYPRIRSALVRMVEPLHAPEVAHTEGAGVRQRPDRSGIQVSFEQVCVTIAGRAVLTDLNLRVDAGEHVAILGASGAGKSTLLGLLLGWNRPSSGRMLVDQAPFDERALQALRAETSWIDPEVYLWNDSLYANIAFGSATQPLPLERLLHGAELLDVIQSMPDGLKTGVGEAGGFLSAGQAQRVRIARAMARSSARLVILDEPVRSLERERRRRMMESFRRHWPSATLLCVTHDVALAHSFPRVILMEGGRVVEQGKPQDLALQPESHYSRMLAQEERIRDEHWTRFPWRRFILHHGALIKSEKGVPRAPAY
jgi:ABC-type bacteriocin/lantibiotic exporter with double-glycine peptidase domain